MNLRIVVNADNELSRRLGLMFRPTLGSDECAFFEFPQRGRHAFWNKNVDFPISLIFCDENQTVKEIKYLEAQQTKIIGSDASNIKYVVEAHVDFPGKIGIVPGYKFSVHEDQIIFHG